jgi:DNA-binding protein WhiA
MENQEIAFAKKVKNEIALNKYSKEEMKYLLSGFIRNAGTLSLGSHPTLTLHTEIASVAKLMYNSLKEVYGLAPVIAYEKTTRFKKVLVYLVTVDDPRLYQVMSDLEIFEDGLFRMSPKKGLLRKNLRFLVIGSFLANGSVNNPSSGKTSYFLEMAFSSKQDSLAIKRKLTSFKEEKTMNFKYIKRREKYVLYLKRSDQISVFLSYIGAVESMFDFENARIVKEDININNRLSICDSANYGKTLGAAQTDIKCVEALLKIHPLDYFDEKTQAVITERLKMKDANYRELADAISKDTGISITKSGVVHILRGLREKAKEIGVLIA